MLYGDLVDYDNMVDYGDISKSPLKLTTHRWFAFLDDEYGDQCGLDRADGDYATAQDFG